MCFLEEKKENIALRAERTQLIAQIKCLNDELKKLKNKPKNTDEEEPANAPLSPSINRHLTIF